MQRHILNSTGLAPPPHGHQNKSSESHKQLQEVHASTTAAAFQEQEERKNLSKIPPPPTFTTSKILDCNLEITRPAREKLPTCSPLVRPSPPALLALLSLAAFQRLATLQIHGARFTARNGYANGFCAVYGAGAVRLL